ncbi:MAG: thiamine pyrophosphate-dependent enzyme, partial [Chloroflexota bacterium]
LYYGHFICDNPLRYRSKEEEQHYRDRDCIRRFEAVVAEHQLLGEAELAAIGKEAEQRVEAAVEFAKSSPLPDVAELTTQVYTEE